MALVLIPPTALSVYVDASTSPLDRVLKLDAGMQLGNGLVRPLQRNQRNDFSNARGLDLVKACVGQILGMRGTSPKNQGELPWDPDRGSLLQLLRHQSNDSVLQAMARVHVVGALQKYEPRVSVKNVSTSRIISGSGQPDIYLINLLYDVLAVNQPGNAVLFSNVPQQVQLPSAA